MRFMIVNKISELTLCEIYVMKILWAAQEDLICKEVNEQVIVGYWYEPFYDDVWVVDQKAYTEQVVDYYECSECGARK